MTSAGLVMTPVRAVAAVSAFSLGSAAKLLGRNVPLTERSTLFSARKVTVQSSTG